MLCAVDGLDPILPLSYVRSARVVGTGIRV